MQLVGTIEKLYFYNYDNGGKNGHYAIFKLKTEDGKEYTCKGCIPFPKVGEVISIEVEKDGINYLIKKYEYDRIYTVDNFFKILIQINGIGKKTAQQICDYIYSKGLRETTDIMNFAQYINEMDLPDGKKQKIYRELEKMSNLMKLFRLLGDSISFYDAFKIIEHAKKNDDVNIILENPYKIIDYYPQVDIKRIDNYMIKYINYDTSSEDRVKMFVKYIMYKQAELYSNYYIDKNELLKKTVRASRVQPHVVNHVIEKMIEENELLALDEAKKVIELPALYNNENYVAEKINVIKNTKSDDVNIKTVMLMLDKLQKLKNIELAEKQKEACIKSFENKITLITGGPGTGKSTIIKFIYMIATILGKSVKVLAPTGKAANRLSELKAQTIHAAIGYDGIEPRKELNEDFIIIDESSMIDIEIMSVLLRQINPQSRVIFVGDHNQLPPVGLGKPFEDLITSGKLPKIELNLVYRQKDKSAIIIDIAHAILNKNTAAFHKYLSEAIKLGVANVFLNLTAEKILEDVVKFLEYGVSQKGYSALYNSVILSPVNIGRFSNGRISKEPCTTLINSIIAERIFNAKSVLKQGEKVVNTENNYSKNVFNGDTGIVGAWDPETNLTYIEFNGKNIGFSSWELANIRRAYSLSVHKSQGMEYPVVGIPILNSQYIFWDNRKLYTAVTRAKNNLIFFGEDGIFEQTISKFISKGVQYKRSRFVDLI